MSKTILTPGRSDLDKLADTLKSAAHGERIAILHLLCNCEANELEVKNIYGLLHLTQSTASRHLNIMKKGGVLKREVRKGKTYYSLNLENSMARCLKKILTKT